MQEASLSDVLVGLAAKQVNMPALVSGRRSLTYGQLCDLSARTAHALLAHGVHPGDNVGIATRDGVDTFVLLFSLWMINATGVVLDFRSPQEERAALARNFDLAVVIEDRPNAAGYAGLSYDDAWHETVAKLPPDVPERMGASLSPAFIGLTSGTTGIPLGLIIEHRQYFTRYVHYIHHPRYFWTGGIYLGPPNLAYSGSRSSVLYRLLGGGTAHFLPPLFGPEEYVAMANSIGATAGVLVPTLIRSLLEHARSQGSAVPLLPTMRALVTGGAMSRPSDKLDALRLLSPNYYEQYSGSVSGPITLLASDEIADHPDSVGRVLPLVRLEIVDDQDRPLSPGEAGIIRLRSPSMVTRTYKDIQREYGDRIKNGWVYPGDLGSLDGGGYLRIVGRATEVIIRGGANVHPAEIEVILSGHPGVADVAVVGFPTPREGEEIAAFVVRAAEVSEAELVARCRSMLAPDKRPRVITFVDALPRNTAGKVLKRDLRQRAEELFAAPSGPASV